eukprot:EG_transcript_26231
MQPFLFLPLLIFLHLPSPLQAQGAEDLVGEAGLPADPILRTAHPLGLPPAVVLTVAHPDSRVPGVAAAVVVALPQNNSAIPPRFTYISGWQRCMFLRTTASSEQLCLPAARPRDCDLGAWWALWDLLGSEVALCDGKRPKFSAQQYTSDTFPLAIQGPFAVTVRWYYPAVAAVAPSAVFILGVLLAATWLRC